MIDRNIRRFFPGLARASVVIIALMAFSLLIACGGASAELNAEQAKAKAQEKQKIKPYSKVITKEAETDDGLFKIHKIGEKLYFEIPNELLDREILLVSRIARTATNLGYGGEKNNTQVVRWSRLGDKILLRTVSYVNVADKELPVYKSILNSNFEPVIQAFDIEAFTKDKKGVVIDVSDLYTKDIPILGLDSRTRKRYKIKAMDKNRSMLLRAKSFPKNIELRHIVTYSASAPPSNPSTGTISLEMNQSFIVLPEDKMMPRLYDERVGFFSVEQTDFGRGEQRATKRKYITRWRLEPKDMEAFKAGKPVEPVKPIVYYIDPATPEKWRPFLKKAVDDWQPAFEKAGFKNAIMGKYPPTKEEDPEFSPEDARYSVIRWFASNVQNAYGPHVHDPRTGEILESDIGLYHNVLRLLRNWYFVQTAAANPEARSVNFKDEVMGELLRYVVAHEVGHTLGLPHNMKASSTYPVEKLRDPEFTEKMGTTPSIMDYARFNYVAQPGDGVKNFIPKISVYDFHSIIFGYRPIPEAKTPDEERPVIDKWIRDKYDDPMYHFGQLSSIDPTSQRECVGSDAMKASEYGIANLRTIMKNLMKWTYTEYSDYSELEELYTQILGQYNRYMGHVVTYIGGVVETRKTYDQEGPVFTIVPAKKQREAMNFLNRYSINPPLWLAPRDILARIENSGIVERIRKSQVQTLNSILDPARMQRLIEHEALSGTDAYTLGEMLKDVRNGVWKGLRAAKKTTVYRRNLQRAYLDRMEWLLTEEPDPVPEFIRNYIGTTDVKVADSDIRPYVRGELEYLKSMVKRSASTAGDKATRLHYLDALARIEKILDPDD